jgi:uncharacterized membrane protein YphA (DoxX/SURF4 family)
VQNVTPSRKVSWWRRLGASPWLVVLARLLVGGVFVFAGLSKLLIPHAEVVAMMQQYTVIPPVVIPLLATFLPWLEVLSGTALFIGFYTTPAAVVIGVQLLSFCGLMTAILLLGIDIEDCGCFGNLGWRETPLQVLVRDLVMLGMLVPIVTRQRDVLALDVWSHVPSS